MDVLTYINTSIEKIKTLSPMASKRPRRIFIAATRQNVGKTTVSLGLIAVLKERLGNIGFIKPVGQRYMLEGGFKVDEDSVLMQRIFGMDSAIQDMSPVAVEKGYTERFLDGKLEQDPVAQIKRSFANVSCGKEAVIIEGTGHAGVGSVFDLSNAAVAKMLDSKVILVSQGGIGNPIDEISLNKSLFDRKGVKLAGVIVNKVIPEKYDKISRYVRVGLERLEIPVLGVVPYVETLDIPTMRDFKEELDMHVLSGEEYLDRQMKKVLVGANDAKETAQDLEDDCMVITPGNRTDLVGLLIKVHSGKFKIRKRIAGLILSGRVAPNWRVYNALKSATIPTLVSRHDTYYVAAKVHDLTVKIKSRDKNKIKLAMDAIEYHVDMEGVMKNLG
ncbi:MAG: AAA family ATPase [Candidatus Omnitrophica bacterium]|nr:AAA family ATPase [Candidatus Omnitrophota bacterium]MDD4012977.1 AAA family ATPase [Candidatus Omnitrophota bacterium]